MLGIPHGVQRSAQANGKTVFEKSRVLQSWHSYETWDGFV